jgi:hypothetical protein
MRLSEYDNHELLNAANYAFWCNDVKFAFYLMDEIALRIAEEHPPNVSKLESQVQKGAKETCATDKGPAGRYEIDDDSICAVAERGRE